MNRTSRNPQAWLTALFLLAPLVLIGIFWSRLPDVIPVHWNWKGEVDGYGPKSMLFIFPGASIFIALLIRLLPKFDPRRENYAAFRSTLDKLVLAFAVFFFGIFSAVLYVALGNALNFASMVLYGATLLMLVIGNFLGKIQPNYFVGIRTPWTLDDAYVWKKTHRFAGTVWVTASLLMLLIGFFLPEQWFFIVFMVYVGLIALVPVVYSYRVFRERQEEDDSNHKHG